MTAVILLATGSILALLGALSAVHAWHPDRYPTTARIAASAVCIVALLSMTLPRLR